MVCWVVVELLKRRSDWMTRLTRHRVLYQRKTSSIVTGWSCHHCTISHHHHTIWWWVIRSNCHWIGPSLSPVICQVSITLFLSYDPFSIMLYHPFSHTMSYAPIFTHRQTNSFPMMTLSLCLHWFIHSHDPLHFLNNLTNCSHPLSCLYSLLWFYLWVACLWSSVTATVLVLKLC